MERRTLVRHPSRRTESISKAILPRRRLDGSSRAGALLGLTFALGGLAAAPASAPASVIEDVGGFEAAPMEWIEIPDVLSQIPITGLAETLLSQEIARRKGRDPEQLVAVVRAAFDEYRPEVPLTFLLAIAHHETHGRVLAVSPSGAVGLAQATPAAYLAEPGFTGRLFLTNAYFVGARCHIMKKPLGDALAIAESLLRNNDPDSRRRARELLAAAYELRGEGMDELEALIPRAPPLFSQRIREADELNAAALAELGSLIERGAPRPETTSYRDRVRERYRSMLTIQRQSWAEYQMALERERDRLLTRRYGVTPATVMATRSYEAGEYLARELDARFSPTEMARFLAAHLTTKLRQARELGVEGDQLEPWTAALYNGGAVNVKRMRAGLISSLVETQRYMERILAMRADLDRILSQVSS